MISLDHRIEKSNFYKEIKKIIGKWFPIENFINKGVSNKIARIFG